MSYVCFVYRLLSFATAIIWAEDVHFWKHYIKHRTRVFFAIVNQASWYRTLLISDNNAPRGSLQFSRRDHPAIISAFSPSPCGKRRVGKLLINDAKIIIAQTWHVMIVSAHCAETSIAVAIIPWDIRRDRSEEENEEEFSASRRGTCSPISPRKLFVRETVSLVIRSHSR